MGSTAHVLYFHNEELFLKKNRFYIHISVFFFSQKQRKESLFSFTSAVLLV